MSAATHELRIGIIGTGHIARQHLACLNELRGVRVVGVTDLSPAVAESVAERFGIDSWFTNHHQMLASSRLDVVHVTTPPQSHFKLAMDSLDAGAHVIVEKPATVRYQDLDTLLEFASRQNRVVLEDYNYVFNRSVQQILHLIETGDFGSVTHVEVMLCLDILGKGSAFVDPNLPHPTASMEGGAIADFLPHLASLVLAFIGPHRSVHTIWHKRSSFHSLPVDEFRAMIDAERGTGWIGFSSHSQPDIFSLRVHGEKMRASASLFEPGLTVDRVHSGPRPLTPLLNGFQDSRDSLYGAASGLVRKLSGGPGSYEGVWALLGKTYQSFATETSPPISFEQIRDVNRLVATLKGEVLAK